MSLSTKIGICGFSLVLIIVCVLLVIPWNGVGTVENLSYERKLEIQVFREVEESNWSVPPSGIEIRHYQSYHHSESYISGYSSSTKCSSDGDCTTSRTPIYSSRPIYRTKYDYRIQKWVTKTWVVKSGQGSPIWPDASDIRSRSDGNPQLGDERVGSSQEVYSVHLRIDNSDVTATVDLDTYTRLIVGKTYHLKKSIIGVVSGISDEVYR